MSSFFTCSFSSEADRAYGNLCWENLVRSCHASKNWVDETDDELTVGAIIDATDATTDAITSGKLNEESSDFFDEPYQSFDWEAEDESTRSASPSFPASVHDTKSVLSLDSRFVGRYLDTIVEEAEEDEEDEVKMVKNAVSAAEVPPPAYFEPQTSSFEIDAALLEGAEEELHRLLYGKVLLSKLNVVLKLSEYIKARPDYEPIPFLPTKDLVNQPSPPLDYVEKLLDITPSHILKRIGLPTDAITRRTPIIVKLPSPDEVLPRYDPLSNLNMLASLASTRSPPPSYSDPQFADLNLLASCC
jgi:hypothetical protein